MSTFHAVNTTSLTVPEPLVSRTTGETTPTTPRPGQFFSTDKPAPSSIPDDSTVKTPTRDTFSALSIQRPLPSEPFGSLRDPSDSPKRRSRMEPKRENSTQSSKSEESEDIEMGGDEDAISDNDSEVGDGNKPSRKKKGQRFYCTEFPPCQLSFTRSEHLARHIRKHTGERPFQCHCSRRFSRLDNLRQHAQTVHVNEDIPTDSLAATGTRFQRQVRTDRVRPTHNRSRPSTIGSQGGHSRGHSRNLSTSSITSTTSSVSQLSQRDDSLGRRRPPPLAMANEVSARSRLSLDTFNPPLMGSPGPTFQNYGNQSPGPVHTPNSATFSGTGSPRFAANVQSPAMRNARPLTWAGAPPSYHGRRLSVPSGANPFQGPPANSQHPLPYVSPLPSSSASSFSHAFSNVASPTSSMFSESRGDSSASDLDWRRRTWHPGTLNSLVPRPATSGLTYFQTPDVPQRSVATQPAANQATRLPGIESFDHAPPPLSLPNRQHSPMDVDGPPRTTLAPPFDPSTRRPEERRNHHSVDLSMQRGISRLNIASPAPPQTVYGWGESQHHPRPATGPRPTTAPHPSYSVHHPNPTASSFPTHPTYREPDSRPGDPPATPKRHKRQGWYNGPLPSQPLATQQIQPTRPNPHSSHLSHRTSPEDSSSSEGIPTPSATSNGEYNPAIVHSNGYIEPYHPGAPIDEQRKNFPVVQPYSSDPNRPSHPINSAPGAPDPYPRVETTTHGGFGNAYPRPHESDGMRRLEALVAVATEVQQNANIQRQT